MSAERWNLVVERSTAPGRRILKRLFTWPPSADRTLDLENMGDRAPNQRIAWALYGLQDGLQDLEGEKPPNYQELYDAWALGQAMGHEIRRRALGRTSDDNL